MLDDSEAVTGAYQAFVDVTAQVKRAGAGSYGVADVQSATGQDRYAGWALVVAYEAPGQPARNLAIFDGLTSVTQGQSAQTIPISGFQTPLNGPVRSELGFVAYEGDAGISGDSAALDGRLLSDGVSATNNFFNSAVSLDGHLVGDKQPDYADQLGFDIKRLRADGFLTNGATSAQIQLRTSKDQYLPGAVTFATELYAPQITARKTVANLTHPGQLAKPGDVLRYAIEYVNDGQDDAQRFAVEDVLPRGTIYLPATLQIGPPGSSQLHATDAPGDDLGEYDARAGAVRFFLGQGATPSRGGTLAAGGGAASVSFSVRVAADAAPGAKITNVAEASYVAATLGTPLSALSTSASVDVSGQPASAPAQSDLSTTQTDTVAPDSTGYQVVDTVTVTNHGPDDATNVHLNDPVPPGVAVDAASTDAGSCVASVLAITCTLDGLQTGASAEVQVVEQLPPAAQTPQPLSEPEVTADQLDPNPQNNTAAPLAQPAPEQLLPGAPTPPAANLVVDERVDHQTDSLGDTIHYTITIHDNGPAEATGVRLEDATSTDATLVSLDAGQATCSKALPLQCSLSAIPAGGDATVSLSVRPLRPGELVSTADVSDGEAASSFVRDSAAAATKVSVRATTVKVSVSVTPKLVRGNQTVRYRLIVTAGGRVPGIGVRVCDGRGRGLQLLSAPRASLTGRRACWTIPVLLPGSPSLLTLNARVSSRAAPGALLRDSVHVSGVNFPARSTGASARVLAQPGACGAPPGLHEDPEPVC